MAEVDQKYSYVVDEWKNKRGVLTLRCSVEHGTSADWGDARKESIT